MVNYARVFAQKLWRGLYRTGRSELRDIGPVVHRRDTIGCTANCPWKHLPKGQPEHRKHTHLEARGPMQFVELKLERSETFVMWIRADLIEGLLDTHT